MDAVKCAGQVEQVVDAERLEGCAVGVEGAVVDQAAGFGDYQQRIYRPACWLLVSLRWVRCALMLVKLRVRRGQVAHILTSLAGATLRAQGLGLGARLLCAVRFEVVVMEFDREFRVQPLLGVAGHVAWQNSRGAPRNSRSMTTLHNLLHRNGTKQPHGHLKDPASPLKKKSIYSCLFFSTTRSGLWVVRRWLRIHAADTSYLQSHLRHTCHLRHAAYPDWHCHTSPGRACTT